MTKVADRLRLYFVTWNVATTFPEQDLNSLLNLNVKNNTPSLDIYIIGLQEVKSQPQNMVMNIFFEDPWSREFRETLKKHDYVKIRTQRLQGIVLQIYCLRKHMTHLRSVECQYTKTGFGGMWGNKGAVSVRLNIYGVSICIVNTHLTPHDHLLADRIADYNTILKQHTFEAVDTSNIFFHDYVFWIGDLNFRLTDGLTASDIELLVKKKELKVLLDKDQLRLVMQSNEAFSELIENEITFPPTYKYEFASQEFDLKRRPSWTDRILYKVNQDVYDDIKLKAVQINYKSHSSYIQSDHKPVTGEFDISVRPHIEDHGIELQVTPWYIGEENSVSYKLLGDFTPGNGDWIGLYEDRFSSLDDYILYEYIGKGKNEDVSTTTSDDTSETNDKRIFFSDTALRAPGMYRLVYVAQQKSAFSILGVSEAFPGHRRSNILNTNVETQRMT